MALVHQIIDLYDDVNRSILKTAGAFPKHLKDSQVLTPDAKEALGTENFALVMTTKEAQVLKKFPMNDEVNTWISCQYFGKTAEQLPFVARKIAASHLKRACAVYGLDTPAAIEQLASNEVRGNHYDEVKSRNEDRAHLQTVKVASAQADGSEHFYALGSRVMPCLTPLM